MDKELTRISIIGAGHVGVVTAVCFAERGFPVILTTLDRQRAETIASGKSPFFEQGLEEALQRVTPKGNLQYMTSTHSATLGSDISFVTVDTPCTRSGEINLGNVRQAMKEIGFALREKTRYHLVVLKSTVVPGTTAYEVRRILEDCSDKIAGEDFGLCMNPEFFREGSALHDIHHAYRVIIGGIDERSIEVLSEVYSKFYGTECPPVLKTNPSTAEAIKYASNAFLAAKISLINELANICERTKDVDVNTVAEGVGLDRRIGPHFLRAGVGFGGSCFYKDLQALTFYAKSVGYKPLFLPRILHVNKYQAGHVVQLAEETLGRLAGRRIAVLGLAFKPDTDDMREAPSTRVVRLLLRKGAEVTVYDPKAMRNASSVFGKKARLACSAKKALDGADCCILLTEWNEFKELTVSDYTGRMARPFLIDGRRLYDHIEYRKGLRYVGIGLGSEESQSCISGVIGAESEKRISRQS